MRRHGGFGQRGTARLRRAPATNVTANSDVVHLDTARVAGWNEIDAVELVGRDGRRQWASSANASSTFAANRTE